MDDIRDLLKEAIRLAGGSQAKLGAACGRTQNTIYHALKLGVCSADLAVRIDRATKGAVPKEKLCPDTFGLHTSEQSVA